MKRWYMIVNKRIRYVMKKVNSARLNGLSEVYLSIDLEEREKALLKNSGYKIKQDDSWVGAGEWESFTISWGREHEDVLDDVTQSKVCMPIERELVVRKDNDGLDKNLSLAQRIKEWERDYPVLETKIEFKDDEQNCKPKSRYGQRELTDIMFGDIFG